MERRLSAIFAADMVGYSRLMEADEAGTLRRQKTYRNEIFDPSISEFSGRMVKEMGDGFLVEFSSVVAAVQCAAQIQQAVGEREANISAEEQIAYRIGINLGDIIVEDDDIYGDGVNVAARLESMAEPGGICISGTAYDHMRTSIAVGYEALGEVRVKNIDRPIRVYRILLDPKLAGTVLEKPRYRTGFRKFGSIGLVLLLAAGLAGGLWFRRTALSPSQSTATQSIAVLPFENMSNDPEQDYLVDGITEDLITDLSKISSLFIIARDSVFEYKGQKKNPIQIAEDLRVRYILEGSVRAAGGRVRINSRLTDTQTGGQIWAQRFDRDTENIFDLQDDVTNQIVTALQVQLTPGEKSLLSHTERQTKPEVYDLYLRGIDALRQNTPASILNARIYFLRSLAIDPDYPRSNAAMAYSYVANNVLFEQDVDYSSMEAFRYGKRALDIAPTLPQGHFAMALAYLREGRHAEALEAARSAVKYDPNYADGYAVLANVLTYSSEGDEALNAINKAMELNPHYSALYVDISGQAYFVNGEYKEAAEKFEDCISRAHGLLACHVFLAATYALGGQSDDAEWQVQEILTIEPGFAVGSNHISPQFKKSEQRETFDRGLRLAGIPAGPI